MRERGLRTFGKGRLGIFTILRKSLGSPTVQLKKNNHKMTLPGGVVQDSQPLCLSSKILSRWHPDFLLFYRPWLGPKLKKKQSRPASFRLRSRWSKTCVTTHTHRGKKKKKNSTSITESMPLQKKMSILRKCEENRKWIHCNYKILLWKVVFSQTAPVSGKTGL